MGRIAYPVKWKQGFCDWQEKVSIRIMLRNILVDFSVWLWYSDSREFSIGDLLNGGAHLGM